ncbi:GATA transcription factor 19 [Solanum lycopersicum]|uniref:GATA-type domain-containing protein n=1 Tax=Solanum lycopersicum TaxID=4081 RepID=A0A3Q7F7K0_SOLLC|nr:GATA transcription factor 19 [Solanum lycopersicum]
MMHRCSGSMVGPCSCGLFHNQSGSSGTTTSSAFSMLFSHEYSENMYSSSSSNVDCTLSLGTPSTRLINEDNHEKRSSVYSKHERLRSSSNCISNFWDILHPKQHVTTPQYKSTRGANNNSTTTDPLVARRCANCDTTSTPLWRNGPRGPKSLCNACGIRFKKEERRASAAAATANGGGGAETTTHQHWVHHHHHSQPTKMACFSSASYGNEFRFIEDNEHHRDSDAAATAIPFFPWRLNVADRPSLVHDFTR